VRAGRLRVARDVLLGAIAIQHDEDGRPLDDVAAAAELLDVLGPIVEIARLVTFAALALYEHMAHRDLEPGDEHALDRFVEEVRRLYPFSSVVTGLARTDFDWRGHDFRCGDLVMFDVYGTNHDPRIWTEPEAFDPNRFRSSLASAWAFVPQGGGSALLGHRCPGERMTIAVLKQAVRLLTTQMRYDVPPQDIGVDLTRVPTLPRSGFVMKHVRRLRRPEPPAAACASKRVRLGAIDRTATCDPAGSSAPEWSLNLPRSRAAGAHPTRPPARARSRRRAGRPSRLDASRGTRGP
jgi:fatty-acid peroxygenase